MKNIRFNCFFYGHFENFNANIRIALKKVLEAMGIDGQGYVLFYKGISELNPLLALIHDISKFHHVFKNSLLAE